MKNGIVLFIIFVSVLFTVSCRKDFSTIPSYGKLTFSNDTIFLDTIFSNISTSTYALKVYNNSGKDIEIPSINLGRNNSSFYRLNVDGVSGNSFENVLLRGRDSLYVFIEGTFNAAQMNSPVYKDSIIFDSGEKLQDVKLITLVKDAHFLFSDLTANQIKNLKLQIDANNDYDAAKKQELKEEVFNEHETLNIFGDTIPKKILNNSELHLTNGKAYVFYDYCLVPDGETLIIDAGTSLHFNENAALVVGKNASIKINGTLENKVVLEGNRLEYLFDDIAGQWHGLWLQKESVNNELSHTIIKNARVGIYCDSISSLANSKILNIKNSEIFNCSDYGIYADATQISGENLIIGNCRLGSLVIKNGGNYNFNHSTFANYWSGSIRRNPTLSINNYTTITNDEDESTIEIENELSQANFTNCFITGNNSQEFELDKKTGSVFNYSFKNCMLKYNGQGENELYDFDNTLNYQNNIFNGENHFKETSKNNFQIGEESDAINKADITEALKTPLDILEIDRTTSPDIGAYQHIIFETEEDETN